MKYILLSLMTLATTLQADPRPKTEDVPIATRGRLLSLMLPNCDRCVKHKSFVVCTMDKKCHFDLKAWRCILRQ